MHKRTPAETAALGPIVHNESYRALVQAIRGGESSLPLFGMPENGKAPLLMALFDELKTSILVVCAGDFAAQRLYGALFPALGDSVRLMPARTVHLAKVRALDRRTMGLRAAALHALISGTPHIVIASVDAVRGRLSAPETFLNCAFSLETGQRIAVEEVCTRLVQGGYIRTENVEDGGEFAVRGGILDIFLPDGTARRIDFFGDEIDSLRVLDPLSQRSGAAVNAVDIPPCVETPMADKDRRALMAAIERHSMRAGEEVRARLQAQYAALSEGDVRTAYEVFALSMPPVSAADYLKEGLLVLDEPMRLSDAATSTDTEIALSARDLADRGQAPIGWHQHLLPYTVVRPRAGTTVLRCSAMMGRTGGGQYWDIRPAPRFQGRMDLLCEDLAYRAANQWRTLILLRDEKRCKNVYQSLSERDRPATLSPDCGRLPEPGETVIALGNWGAGYMMDSQHMLVLTEAELFRTTRSTLHQAAAPVRQAALDLKSGDACVHDVHGIGVYRGLQTITVEGRPRDVIMIEYRDGDKLYVPADQLDRVQRYVGSEGAPPRLSKMGGQEWTRAKKKVSQSVKKLAQDLVAIYAARQALKGHAFAPDAPWQQEFEDAFIFEATEGQTRAVDEIKADMEAPRIMDRLLCGDVGYGKTEVAMRAIFKCVMDAKQAMVLVPTTVLAQQHYNSMTARFAGYPIRTEMISRFRTKTEQAQILSQFNEGKIDVLVGTHRLLGADVKPYDLGLLVIDEEQRFGVGHKESIQDIKRTVDVLTMTATPIPRTMEMSLAGIRDMSIIHTPPEQRRPVNTFVSEESDDLIREALQRELARNGQVYVIYNQVQRMTTLTERLRQLVPDARIGMAHGQMPEVQLEKAMLAFFEGETDVLVCSTIVENGMDVTQANTMIVLDADRLGLSQMYQLRGRVGRSAREAYCYFMTPENKQISETAQKRLDAVQTFTELGSGFRIAMRDLEIRGAGNLLGPEQHGHMHNVGYDTYCRLLAQAVAQARGQEVREEIETKVDAPLAAHIPDEYIKNQGQKVQTYRAIADIAGEEDASRVLSDLRDRFGEVPGAVRDLVSVSLLRARAHALGIEQVTVRPDQVRMKFAAAAQPDPDALMASIRAYGPGAQLMPGSVPTLMLRAKGRSVHDMLASALAFFAH
ncbi:MAG: transcription-repair coupling factor [Clostridia bacterium]|nr:transcription-repair coupling factor [Clostridia bacterium]